jgi:hypothetical protein
MDGVEWHDLCEEIPDDLATLDGGGAGDVEDPLLRIHRADLPARFRE